MTNEIKPAWCGLPRQDPRVKGPRTFLGEWQSPKGPIAYCSWECREVRRRVGWHAKQETPMPTLQGLLKQVTEEVGERVRTDVFGPVHDLTKEHAKAKNEIKRLKHKVNSLLGEIKYSRHRRKLDELALIQMTDKRNECIRQNTVFREENENLRKALDGLGQKNDALMSDKAKLHGNLVTLEARLDECQIEANDRQSRTTAELLERVTTQFRARSILEGFVFEVMDEEEKTREPQRHPITPYYSPGGIFYR